MQLLALIDFETILQPFEYQTLIPVGLKTGCKKFAVLQKNAAVVSLNSCWLHWTGFQAESKYPKKLLKPLLKHNQPLLWPSIMLSMFQTKTNTG